MPSESTAAALQRKAANLRQVAAARAGTLGGVRVTIRDDSAGRGAGDDRLFAGVLNLPQHFPAALQGTIPAIRAEHEQVFATQGAAGRGVWASLAPRTVAERRRLGYGGTGPILSRRGSLRAHVLGTPAVVQRTPTGWQLRIAPDADVDGVRKYRALALGDPDRNLPGRPMVTVGPAGATRITSVLSRRLRQLAGL